MVTQPPKPVGRKQTVTATPVETLAKEQSVPVLSFPSHPEKSWLYENEETVADTLAPFKADILISASFGQKIPARTMREAKYAGVNVHPSILPRWRGADPVPWAILTGDHQIGVTIVTLTETFDEGKILAQHKIPMGDNELSDPLRTKLFTLGAELLGSTLPDFLSGALRGTAQDPKKASYARKFTRDDGFIPWKFLEALQNGETMPPEPHPGVFGELAIDNYQFAIERAMRALSPWPGLWTMVTVNGEEKRLKILDLSIIHSQIAINSVQLEGKKPVSWKQFASVYLAHTT